MTDKSSTNAPSLDRRQLALIESVHRGFLYQHLYAMACLFLAANAGATQILVENDEDVEILLPGRHIYIQVKTRSGALISSDIAGALERFDALRAEHSAGRRQGTASFVIATNSAPGPRLTEKLIGQDWPKDIAVQWPDSGAAYEACLPRPWYRVDEAFSRCCELAATLPFALLAPETLVWKLAGQITAAAAGVAPHADHVFQTQDLPKLFEQLAIQLQDFPAPPLRYRPQDEEPPLLSLERVRLITGFSGAGKTSWVSQAALHATDVLTYFNVSDAPGTAMATAIARDLAARLFGKPSGKLGDILLPGATGTEILFAIGRNLAENGLTATLVIDNAHRVPADDIRSLIDPSPHLRFVLLAQPGPAVALMEATLGIRAELLRGWTSESVAAEGAALGCHGDYAAYEQLLSLTAGLPLYAQNALQIAAASYAGSVSRFCRELEAQTHIVETAQEIILARVFGAFSEDERRAIGTLSLADIPLSQQEAAQVLRQTFALDDRAVAAICRKLRTTGAIQIFGGDHLKVHDAIRLLGRAHLDTLCSATVRKAQAAIRDLLLSSLPRGERQRVFLLLRMFVALGEVKILVQMATDELFHELGYMADITGFLEQVAALDGTPAEDRFWALDGLVFGQIKTGTDKSLGERLALMDQLITQNGLGPSERLAVGMKKMLVSGKDGDVNAVQATMRRIMEDLPDQPEFVRIARYNYALALFRLKIFEGAIEQTSDLIKEYYGALGLSLADVRGKNPDQIWPLLEKDIDHTDELKHLADTLELQAMAVGRLGNYSPFARIHAMKFYYMAHALDSFVRVGQDLADEFIGRRDYIGARDVLERNVLPVVLQMKMMGHIVAVRSQYAVVLAYCGAFSDAEAEMVRLNPYESGLNDRGRIELQEQRGLIAQLKRRAPAPQ